VTEASPVTPPDPSPAGRVAAAVRASRSDWLRSFALTSLWTNLAIEDLRDRYRRTFLGLSWIVTSFALFVAVKIFIFGPLNAATATEFGVFVTLGFGLWTYINAMVVDACTAYMHSRAWILGTATPYPVFLLQSVARNWMIFAMILAVMAIALWWKPSPWRPVMLGALPGLAIYLLSSVWMATILAPLCARYRDLYHTVQTGLRLVFFATPILWMPDTNGRLARIAELNPLSHFIAIVRDPLMYDRIPLDSWTVVLWINVAGLAAAVAVYVGTRRHVAHWV
jgi:ABC-type polysaccharide/polyol phosphate export permease